MIRESNHYLNQINVAQEDKKLLDSIDKLIIRYHLCHHRSFVEMNTKFCAKSVQNLLQIHSQLANPQHATSRHSRQRILTFRFISKSYVYRFVSEVKVMRGHRIDISAATMQPGYCGIFITFSF